MGKFARRLATLCLLLLLPSLSAANGAMGLGLEMWDLTYWFVYVGVTVVVEAWLIGRGLGVSWLKSVLLSLLANLLTAALCGGGGMCAPLLHHPFVGSRMNPNPLMNSVALLAIFAVPSALLEAIVWSRAAKGSDMSILWRSVWVHLATIPLALAILLIPEQPYRGLVGGVKYERRMALSDARHPIMDIIQRTGKMPTARTLQELTQQILQNWSDAPEEFGLAFYDPVFYRFSTSDPLTRPYELNTALAGKPITMTDDGKDRWTWYVRPPASASPYRWGLAVDMNSGQIKLSRDPDVMGY